MGKKVSGWSVLSLTGLQSPGGISSPCMFPCMETAFPSITRCLAHTVHALSVATLVGQIRTLLTAGPGPVHECKHRGSILCLPALGQKAGILLICADRISVVLHAPCSRDQGSIGCLWGWRGGSFSS